MSSPNSSTLWWTSWTWSSLCCLLLRWSSNFWLWDLMWDLLHTFFLQSLHLSLCSNGLITRQHVLVPLHLCFLLSLTLALSLLWITQHYFIDAWNSFDALIVVGSLVDIMIAEFSVCIILKLKKSEQWEIPMHVIF